MQKANFIAIIDWPPQSGNLGHTGWKSKLGFFSSSQNPPVPWSSTAPSFGRLSSEFAFGSLRDSQFQLPPPQKKYDNTSLSEPKANSEERRPKLGAVEDQGTGGLGCTETTLYLRNHFAHLGIFRCALYKSVEKRIFENNHCLAYHNFIRNLVLFTSKETKNFKKCGEYGDATRKLPNF